MSIADAERLVKLLEKARNVDEFVVVDRSGVRASATTGANAGRRRVDLHRLEATVYRDVRRGRGSASFIVPDHDTAAAAALIAAATSRAENAAGPAWTLPPPAAPARVSVADLTLGEALVPDAEAIASQLAEAANEAALTVGLARVDVERVAVSVITSSGFDNSFETTDLHVDAIVTNTGAAERVRAHARRAEDLHLADRTAGAAERMADRSAATELEPGTYDIALAGPALTLDVTGSISTNGSNHELYGWFGPIVAQSSASMARQRLTRYRPGQSIYDIPATGDPLTITSDGTLDYGLHSRPFGELGEPVRRFTLVEDGVAAGLSLDLREAALRGVNPNGGVRNLVVASGATPAADLLTPDAAPLLEIAELGWLETNPRTGGFVAEIGLAYASGPARTRAPVVGGTIRGSIFDVLAAARLSKERAFYGWYDGPTVVRLSGIAVR